MFRCLAAICAALAIARSLPAQNLPAAQVVHNHYYSLISSAAPPMPTATAAPIRAVQPAIADPVPAIVSGPAASCQLVEQPRQAIVYQSAPVSCQMVAQPQIQYVAQPQIQYVQPCDMRAPRPATYHRYALQWPVRHYTVSVVGP